MKILVLLAHPSAKSFNRAIAGIAVRTLKSSGHAVIFRDLYRERFDPVLRKNEIPDNARLAALVERHCRDLVSADGIIIVHPNWWGQPPAILTGWIDRVIRPGVAYRFDEGDGGGGVPRGLLKAKAALIVNTSNTPFHREKEVFGDPLETIWKKCVFDFCGVKRVCRKNYGVIVTSSLRRRKLWLEDVRKTVRRYFPPER